MVIRPVACPAKVRVDRVAAAPLPVPGAAVAMAPVQAAGKDPSRLTAAEADVADLLAAKPALREGPRSSASSTRCSESA